MSVFRILTEAVDRWGDRCTLRDDRQVASFARVLAEARSWQTALRLRGVRPGDRVVLAMENRIELVTTLFGVLGTGAIGVPIAGSSTARHLRAIVSDAEPRVIVTSRRVATALEFSDSEHTVVLVDDGTPHARATDGDAPAPDTGDPALLLYTSGSTGRQKGIVCDHGAILFAASAIASMLAYRSDDVVLSALPLAFDYGLYQVFLALLSGSHLVIAPEGGGPRLAADVERHGATVVPVVPTMARRLSLLARRAGTSRSTVRLFTNTGETLGVRDAAGLRDAFPGAHIVSMFGLTECKRVSIGEPDEDLVAPGAVGRALPGTRIEVRDASGHVLGANREGQLVVEGPHVMAGYWRMAEATRATFRTSALGRRQLMTGDYGFIDRAGRFHFTGRRDSVFKLRGMRVSTTEIEAAALEIANVRAAACIPPAADGEPTLAVVGDVLPEAVLQHVGAVVGMPKTPARCVIVNKLPITANGKLDRNAIAKMLR